MRSIICTSSGFVIKTGFVHLNFYFFLSLRCATMGQKKVLMLKLDIIFVVDLDIGNVPPGLLADHPPDRAVVNAVFSNEIEDTRT